MATRSIKYHCEFIKENKECFYIASDTLNELFTRAIGYGAIGINEFIFNSRKLNAKKDYYNLKYFNKKENEKGE